MKLPRRCVVGKRKSRTVDDEIIKLIKIAGTMTAIVARMPDTLRCFADRCKGGGAGSRRSRIGVLLEYAAAAGAVLIGRSLAWEQLLATIC
ncbi:MAG TPA: hypothetical protein VKY85_00760 [Candidatus Angelobacter sp.]|nr:hypothetical protein [Candidatus Angelobacter sp.]